MKLLYFFLTTSFMISLVLLFRKLFRKKLSANVIYALWLLPFLRLLIPVGFLEVPVFGTVAEFINRPVAVVEEFFKTSDEISVGVYEGTLIPEETSTSNINAGKPSDEGIKIYDAVFPKENYTVQIPKGEATLNDTFVHETTDNNSNINYIISIIWCAGSIVLGCYVFVQNRRLRRKINQLESVDQIDGVDICISKAIKIPCLVGVHKPKIVLTGEVYVTQELYKYAILHEIEHYHNRDHIWNMARIFLCILYWWHPLVWYAAKCVAEDAELACDERVLNGKTIEDRKKYGYALLKMIENAQNKPLCLTTSFSGNKKSMKHRIEAISHKRTTRKYILFPVLLVLAALFIAGCVYPSDKSYIETTDWENVEINEYNEEDSNQQVNDNNAIDMSEVKLVGNSTNAAQIIKQAEERAREGYKEAKLTYADNAEVGWNFYNDNPWASAAERDALAQAALKELYTLTGYNVEECIYTTNGRSKFIFGKSAENIKKSIAFYSRDYGFTLFGDEIPFMGFVNARKVHYSDVQQLDSPYHKKEFQGNGAIAAWFLEHSGVYQGEKITGFDAINLDDTVYTHIKLMFDGGYYIVLMDEKIESFHSAEGPFFE